MIQSRSVLFVSDNSGAKVARCIQVIGGSKRKSHGVVGDIIVASVINSSPGSKIKKGQVVKAVVVRTRSISARNDSGSLRFDDNAVVLIDKDGEPIASRVFGPISREVKLRGYNKIASLASEVI